MMVKNNATRLCNVVMLVHVTLTSTYSCSGAEETSRLSSHVFVPSIFVSIYDKYGTIDCLVAFISLQSGEIHVYDTYCVGGRGLPLRAPALRACVLRMGGVRMRAGYTMEHPAGSLSMV